MQSYEINYVYSGKIQEKKLVQNTWGSLDTNA